MNNFPIAMADGIREKWINGLNNISSVSKVSLGEVILTKPYMLVLTTPDSPILFQIQQEDIYLPQAFAMEAARFSSASLESLVGASPSVGNEQSLGWPLIRTYYSAFFSAHALLRLCGESVTFLSTDQVNRLNQIITTYTNQPSNLSSGIFHFKTISDSKQIQISQMSRGGGPHEDFWKVFYRLLIDIENVLVSKYSASQDAIKAIETSKLLRESLSRNRCTQGSWLSQSRNNINYRYEYGIWFPYKIKQKEALNIIRTLDNWKLEFADWSSNISTTNTIEAHVNNCHAITAILMCALKDLSRRSITEGKSFVDKLPFKFIRQRQPGWA